MSFVDLYCNGSVWNWFDCYCYKSSRSKNSVSTRNGVKMSFQTGFE